jgi:hypothetical protein
VVPQPTHNANIQQPNATQYAPEIDQIHHDPVTAGDSLLGADIGRAGSSHSHMDRNRRSRRIDRTSMTSADKARNALRILS